MKLRTQKTIFKAFSGTALAGAVLYGASGLFSGDDVVSQTTAERAVVAQTETAAAEYAPTPEPIPAPAPVRQGDTPEEKAEKLAAMQARDVGYLAQNGFTNAVYTQYGTCGDNGVLTDERWRGVATGLLYVAEKDGAEQTVCVRHAGGRPVSLTSDYVAAAAPVAEAPVTAADEPFTRGTTDAERDQKLADMRVRDAALLQQNGMTLVRRLNVGESCAEDGSISGDTKWKGTASSIMYEARMDGQRLQVCINHRGGRPDGQVTGSAYNFD